MHEWATVRRDLADGLPGQERYEFAGLVLDLPRGQLTRNGFEVALRPKTFEVLTYFVTRPGRLVTKHELLAALWPDVIVTDDSVVQCLMELRRALGEAGELLKTVRGRGYRFEGEVEALPPPVAPAGAPGAAASTRTSSPLAAGTTLPSGVVSAAGRPPGRRLTWIVAGAGLAMALLVVAHGMVSRGDPARGSLARVSAHPDAVAHLEAGQRALNQFSRVGTLTAVREFEAAVARDRDYAAGWAGLSNALTMQHIFGAVEPAAVLPRALEAAERAVALDATFAEAHGAHAHVSEQWSHDWATAARSHRRALALDPRNTQLLRCAALFFVTQGQAIEAIAYADRAVALAPENPLLLAARGLALLLAGQRDEAERQLRAAVALRSSTSVAHFWLAVVRLDAGDYDGALASALASSTDAANEPTAIVGVVHARMGRVDAARDVRQALEAKAATSYVPPLDLAVIDIALGEHERALDEVERAARTRARWVPGLANNPLFADVRQHPRFVALLQRLGLPARPAGEGADTARP